MIKNCWCATNIWRLGEKRSFPHHADGSNAAVRELWNAKNDSVVYCDTTRPGQHEYWLGLFFLTNEFSVAAQELLPTRLTVPLRDGSMPCFFSLRKQNVFEEILAIQGSLTRIPFSQLAQGGMILV